MVAVSIVHPGPKANTNKTQTSRFTWFLKTGYIHGGSRLYIKGGIIQTLNSTQYNPTKPSVSLLHSFLSNLHLHSLSQLHCLPLSAHTCTVSMPSLVSLLSSISLHEKGKHKYSGCKGEGGW